MTISSRTPEGESFRCHVCGAEARLEPSLDSGDAPCPCCGSLVWFAATDPCDVEQAQRVLRRRRPRPEPPAPPARRRLARMARKLGRMLGMG